MSWSTNRDISEPDRILEIRERFAGTLPEASSGLIREAMWGACILLKGIETVLEFAIQKSVN